MVLADEMLVIALSDEESDIVWRRYMSNAFGFKINNIFFWIL